MTGRRCGLLAVRRRSFSTARAAAPQRPREDFLSAAASHWQSLVTRAVGAALLRDGFAVVPDAFPPSFTRLLRDEIRYLHASEQMYANATHIVVQGEPTPTLLEKHHIVETELVLPEIRQQVPALEWFFDSQQVFQAVGSVVPDWLALSDYMIKLQYNEGHGGCFPMHFDSYGDDGKCITAVLYLNEQWRDGDGGEIVLYPFPRQEPIVVRPLDGQLVLFSSQHMLHRVLPTTTPRYCLTTWMYSKPDEQTARGRAIQYQPSDLAVSPRYELQVMDKIMRSPFRRHLAKILYSEEWARSLHESHRQTAEFAKYMATHEHEVSVINAATTQMLAKFRAKDPTQPSKLPATADQLFAVMRDDDQCQAFLKQLPIAWF